MCGIDGQDGLNIVYLSTRDWLQPVRVQSVLVEGRVVE